ncbi:MAG: hypothetical protein ABIH22_01830 [Candidatus Margulisiibacteriota bacterium]
MFPLLAALASACSVNSKVKHPQLNEMRTSRAAEPVKIPNLRFSREPQNPWVVEAADLSATVQAKTLSRSIAGAKWQLEIDLDVPGQNWQLLSAASPTLDVVASAVPTDEMPASGPRRVELEVSAPSFCSTKVEREPVILSVNYINEKGRPITVSLEVDHRCLLGDIVDREDASTYAAMAEKYRSDPAIQRLLSRAKPYPLGSVREEAARLKEWAGYSYALPPNDDVKGWHKKAYGLSPTETMRLGGRCTDWSVVVAAYFAVRGFPHLSIAYTTGHMWVQVADWNGKPVNVDIVNEKPSSEPPLLLQRIQLNDLPPLR